MHCCETETKPKKPRRLWRYAGGSVSSGILLVLLPKCPMCIAAYLTVLAGAALPVATHLRTLLEATFLLSVLFIAGQWMRTRRRPAA